ncbi:MAG: preprotein translocase subunit YajC [Bacteroidetes bacterium RIFOXYA12_FULL_35_11]|nr:MAG: preprotein translocase subunit YajC [Bacteroidetes bacterium GWF2_35_48]OFY76558.1 MAG: preprotein translocase subunit YajC [Bacteroidetes bacterium RIFOXYA12_FULL_35_11]OFZ01107.1 MAG: preprotein translocase subunit YajC [Bacteroidetes bacterium RIFOXYC12_FULL_35_7]HBX52328.1 preprotein translocase subunit YajC [Bacteroidales bacterium]
MNNLLLVLAQAGGQSPYASLIFLVLIIVVFYFFMIRPQMKKQKELKKMRESLKNGDKVITSGGIYGKIIEVKDNAIIVEIDANVRIKVDKNFVHVDAASIPQQK